MGVESSSRKLVTLYKFTRLYKQKKQNGNLYTKSNCKIIPLLLMSALGWRSVFSSTLQQFYSTPNRIMALCSLDGWLNESKFRPGIWSLDVLKVCEGNGTRGPQWKLSDEFNFWFYSLSKFTALCEALIEICLTKPVCRVRNGRVINESLLT